MKDVEVIILAAGAGTRMGSDIPKVLIPLGGKPLIAHLLQTLNSIGLKNLPSIVVGYQKEKVIEALGPKYKYIEQTERKGTGHAVLSARDSLKGRGKIVLTFFGDTPFASADTIKRIIDKTREENAVMTMGVTRVPDFKDWRGGFFDFGRIIRNTDGRIVQNIEKKHFTEEIADIKEINPGFYCFNAHWLWENIDRIPPTPPANEHYLPSLIEIAISHGEKIADVEIDPRECLGANTPEHLSVIEQLLSSELSSRVKQ